MVPVLLKRMYKNLFVSTNYKICPYVDSMSKSHLVQCNMYDPKERRNLAPTTGLVMHPKDKSCIRSNQNADMTICTPTATTSTVEMPATETSLSAPDVLPQHLRL